MNQVDETALNIEKLYDMSYVNQSCHNNIAAISKMVTVFVNTIPAAIDELKQFCELQDYDAVKKITHRIKPVIMYYAIVKAERVVLNIEYMAINSVGLYGLEEEINILKKTVDDVVVAMKKEFNI